MAADGYVVCDLHQIVDLGALADYGIAIAAPIDGGTGANLHIVLDDHAPGLRNFSVPARRHDVAKSILPDRAAWMHNDAVAYETIGYACPRANHTVAPNAYIWPDYGTGADQGARSNFGMRANHAPRVYRDLLLEAGRRMHKSSKCRSTCIEKG